MREAGTLAVHHSDVCIDADAVNTGTVFSLLFGPNTNRIFNTIEPYTLHGLDCCKPSGNFTLCGEWSLCPNRAFSSSKADFNPKLPDRQHKDSLLSYAAKYATMERVNRRRHIDEYSLRTHISDT